ncbi:mitochondrial acyl carrier protein [Savitreella phatthalungensis]
MFRTGLRSIAAAAARPAFTAPRQSAVLATQQRFYAGSSVDKSDIEARVLDIVRAFDKVKDPSKISATSSFANDLGLDSLDTVEVVMAIEEEFNVEIPDKEADEIKSVGQAVEYIASHPDAR